VYYIEWGGDHISRVLLDGSGKTEAIYAVPQGYSFTEFGMNVSPDGKTLAAAVQKEQEGQAHEGARKIVLFDLGSSSPPQMLDVNSNYMGGVQFTPDGKSIAYSIREHGVENVWIQPLAAGSAGHSITDFKSEQIWSSDLSPDGKRLAVLRGHYDADVVLLQESKP
jgi:Tol biopolymer transport system component